MSIAALVAANGYQFEKAASQKTEMGNLKKSLEQLREQQSKPTPVPGSRTIPDKLPVEKQSPSKPTP